MKIESINILGINVKLTALDRKTMKGLPLLIIGEFYIYNGIFRETEYIFYQSKSEKECTPSVYAYYTEKINGFFNKPVVLITNKRDYNNRMRLFEQGVYFVASEKFAFLPNLVVNALGHNPKKKNTRQLSPKAQFLLLYWMQEKSLGADVSIATFSEKWNFSYVSISRALSELEQFGLCDSTKNKDNSKTYHFRKEKKTVWNESQEILRNPVSRIVFTDEAVEVGYRITGINALSHYSWLNPEETDSVAVLDSEYRTSLWKAQTNDIEGKYRIEVWCYEPAMFADNKYVDRLSLVLSLRGEAEADARVEGEINRIINELQW